MVMNNLDNLLTIAKEAAIIGAETLRDRSNVLKEARYGRLHDVKLKADKIAENSIISFLSSKSNIKIISEEIWETAPFRINNNSSDLLWVVDPLDGSYNFLHDIPLCCISIALWEGMKGPLLGVIYNFNNDELYYGIAGKGSWMNDLKISTSDKKDKGKAILCTGFPVNMNYSEENLIEFISKIRNWSKVRLFGSAGLSLAYVAAGRVDAYQEEDIMFWDVAAGITLVLSAGGMVNFVFSDEQKLTMRVIATNSHLNMSD